LNSSGKERGGSFLFSKACKSLNRRRFKEIEDAPRAAYFIHPQKSKESNVPVMVIGLWLDTIIV
jgi:hypothetical protein